MHSRARHTPGRSRPAIEAVLFDRDGTLVVDDPGNFDAARARTMPGALEALALLRGAGYPVGVVTNQPCGGHDPCAHRARVAGMHEDLGRRLGIEHWFACTHDADAGCACRKPRPGLILRASERMGVRPQCCIVVGDIESDLAAAAAAGARGLMVPTQRTLADEIVRAHALAGDLVQAAWRIIGGEV